MTKSPLIHVAPYHDMLHVIHPVDVTSYSMLPFGKALSPFFLGPVSLYDGHIAQNVENAWQYAKVYPAYADDQGMPTPEYFAWAEEGWNETKANRHPLGKTIKPLYSWWNGRKLGYIPARKEIYIPLYAAAAATSIAFLQLRDYCISMGEVTLVDFDGYDFEKKNMSFIDVVYDSSRRMGHAFVLWMLLNDVDITRL